MRAPLSVAALALLLVGGWSHALAGNVDDAITELDLDRARRLLDGAKGNAESLGLTRARLALYAGECDVAEAQLSAPTLGESREGAELLAVAANCARATAAAFVVEDRGRGIVLRLQDDADRVLAPFLFDVAANAREALERDLGTDLPRPLRIDLVRDLFSLSAVSGLPLAAAETTGTLAVARWGRVIMLTPRATTNGYPWQDTLAHELTHLVVTRATRDHAPLWLQEGVAKREESRWRNARPFDDPTWADSMARRALESGRSVGIDNLGPSIAMLPTPEAASIAYAEVSSFVTHFVAVSGRPALELLFLDLKGTGPRDANPALVSVSGYTLSEWNRRWQAALLEIPPRDPRTEREAHRPTSDGRGLVRRIRLGDLLSERGALKAALVEYDEALALGPHEASVRHRAARTSLAVLPDDEKGSEERLGRLADVRAPHGGWFALEGRRLKKGGATAEALTAQAHSLGLDPLSEDVACEGEPGTNGAAVIWPSDPNRRKLCEAVRREHGRAQDRRRGRKIRGDPTD
jgi:hypothetical protein